MKYVYDPILKKFRAKDDYMAPEQVESLKRQILTLDQYSQLEEYDDKTIYFITNPAHDRITTFYVGTLPYVPNNNNNNYNESTFNVATFE